MSELVYDIVVVGAGPAGGVAARHSAKGGARVLIVEEHNEVGVPVNCAEGASEDTLRDAGVRPKPPIISQRIEGVRVHAPNMKYVEISGAGYTGYILNRDVFDRELVYMALDSGADMMLGARVVDLIFENGVVKGVVVRRRGRLLKIRANVVIGADGFSSIVRRRAGLGRITDLCSCIQYRLANVELDDPHMIDVYLGTEVAPGGYAWVFPKSDDVANVGLGVRRIHKAPAIEYLKRFIKRDPRFRKAKPILVNGGPVPVCGPLERLVGDGVMLAGDAAAQVVPCTGAGIHSSVDAGRMAGEVAAEAVRVGDFSRDFLSNYEKVWREGWGRRMRDSRKVVKALDRLSDEDLNTLASILTSEDVLNLANGVDVVGTVMRIMTRAPATVIKTLFTYLTAK